MSVIAQLERELLAAGSDGLTRRECQRIAGAWYGKRLRELEERGYLLNRRRGRYGRTWFRVCVVLPPRHAAQADDAPAALFDADHRPASALIEDAA